MNVNLTGYLLGMPGINATSNLGLFTFLHFQSFEGSRTIKRMVFVAMTLMVAYTVGLIIGQIPLIAPIAIGLLAFFARLIYRLYRIDKPGDIFVILVMAAAATRDIPLNQMPVQLLEFNYGIVVSLIMAYILVKYLHLPKQTFTFHLAEYFIPRNYSMGIFFVTNMVLIQLTFQNPNLGFDYLSYRFEGIVIGTLIGSLAAYLQYHLYKFYSQSMIQDRTYDYKEKMAEGVNHHDHHLFE
ncbi:hypothetical protein ACN672_04440 [Aerococcus viridans]